MELDYESPQLVIVPGGYANGFQFLTKEGELLVFSDYLLEESQKDDYRFEKDLFYSW
ncbi:hypothetical protein V8V91_04225 [Algoriphagus halophilus]|uniref:hypothetical protein n=1 Tax=Algoriphagus halophilus TaxID=226505 RepID=UPI00358EE333